MPATPPSRKHYKCSEAAGAEEEGEINESVKRVTMNRGGFIVPLPLQPPRPPLRTLREEQKEYLGQVREEDVEDDLEDSIVCLSEDSGRGGHADPHRVDRGGE